LFICDIVKKPNTTITVNQFQILSYAYQKTTANNWITLPDYRNCLCPYWSTKQLYPTIAVRSCLCVGVFFFL